MNKAIVLSSCIIHGRFLPKMLAKKLEKNGIDVLLTDLSWPRDEIYIHSNGKVDTVIKNTAQGDSMSNFAWNGGTYLKGDNFILGSLTANPIEKQERTHKVLGIDNGHYFDISEELDSLNHIMVGKRHIFYGSDFPHIDAIYNLGNSSGELFTYDNKILIETGEKMCDLIGYDLTVLPLEESRFASVGFVEVEDKIILDCRAKKTKKILEKIGYQVILTSMALMNTNRGRGSLRCITSELPFEIDNLELVDLTKITGMSNRIRLEHSIFSDIRGFKVRTKGMSYDLHCINSQ